jgi:hypothetical protein
MASPTHDARGQTVHRCIGADGRSAYTDRECSELHAVERKPPPAPAASGAVLHVRDCARSPDDLLFGVRAALDAQDVNKLASFYLWTDIGSQQGMVLMDRLDALSRRPLVDLALEGGDPLATVMVDGEERPRPTPPDSLQLLQARSADSMETTSTRFRLQRSHGCWWLRF